MKRKIIHLVDDESIIHDIFKKIFHEPEYELRISENKSQAKTNHSADADVVIMDQMIPGSSGLEIFKELKKDDPEIKAIFLTAFGTIEAAIEAIKHGAVDYLQKPFNNIELKHKVDRVIKEKKLNRENTQLKKTLERPVFLRQHHRPQPAPEKDPEHRGKRGRFQFHRFDHR